MEINGSNIVNNKNARAYDLNPVYQPKAVAGVLDTCYRKQGAEACLQKLLEMKERGFPEKAIISVMKYMHSPVTALYLSRAYIRNILLVPENMLMLPGYDLDRQAVNKLLDLLAAVHGDKAKNYLEDAIRRAVKDQGLLNVWRDMGKDEKTLKARGEELLGMVRTMVKQVRVETYHEDRWVRRDITVNIDHKAGRYYACSSKDGKTDGIAFIGEKAFEGAGRVEAELAGKADPDVRLEIVHPDTLVLVCKGERYEVENTKENIDRIWNIVRYAQEKNGLKSDHPLAVHVKLLYALRHKSLGVYGFNVRQLQDQKDVRGFIDSMTALENELAFILGSVEAGVGMKDFFAFMDMCTVQLKTLKLPDEDIKVMLTRLFVSAKMKVPYKGPTGMEEWMSVYAKQHGLDTRLPAVSLEEQLQQFIKPFVRHRMDPEIANGKLFRVIEGRSVFLWTAAMLLDRGEGRLRDDEAVKKVILQYGAVKDSSGKDISHKIKELGLRDMNVKTCLYLGPKFIEHAGGERVVDQRPVCLIQAKTKNGEVCFIDPATGEHFLGRNEKEALALYVKYSPLPAGGHLAVYADGTPEEFVIEYSNLQRIADIGKTVANVVGTVAMFVPGGITVSMAAFGISTAIETGEIVMRKSDGREISYMEYANIATQWAMIGGGLIKEAMLINRTAAELRGIAKAFCHVLNGAQFAGFGGMSVMITYEFIESLKEKDLVRFIGVLQNILIMVAVAKLQNKYRNAPKYVAREYARQFKKLSPDMQKKIFGEKGMRDPASFDSADECLFYMQEHAELLMHTVKAEAIEWKIVKKDVPAVEQEKVYLKEKDGTYREAPTDTSFDELLFVMADDACAAGVESALKAGKAVTFKDACIIPDVLVSKATHLHRTTGVTREKLDMFEHMGPKEAEEFLRLIEVSTADKAHALRTGTLDVLLRTEEGDLVNISMKMTAEKGTRRIASFLVRDLYTFKGGKIYRADGESVQSIYLAYFKYLNNDYIHQEVSPAITGNNDRLCAWYARQEQYIVKSNYKQAKEQANPDILDKCNIQLNILKFFAGREFLFYDLKFEDIVPPEKGTVFAYTFGRTASRTMQRASFSSDMDFNVIFKPAEGLPEAEVLRIKNELFERMQKKAEIFKELFGFELEVDPNFTVRTYDEARRTIDTEKGGQFYVSIKKTVTFISSKGNGTKYYDEEMYTGIFDYSLKKLGCLGAYKEMLGEDALNKSRRYRLFEEEPHNIADMTAGKKAGPAAWWYSLKYQVLRFADYMAMTSAEHPGVDRGKIEALEKFAVGMQTLITEEGIIAPGKGEPNYRSISAETFQMLMSKKSVRPLLLNMMRRTGLMSDTEIAGFGTDHKALGYEFFKRMETYLSSVDEIIRKDLGLER